MAGRFIIFQKKSEDQLGSVFGCVSYHDELRFTNDGDGNIVEDLLEQEIRGGGWYEVYDGVLYLFGSSIQFGSYFAKNNFIDTQKAIVNSYFWKSNNLKSIFVIPSCKRKDDFESTKNSGVIIYINHDFVSSPKIPTDVETNDVQKVEKLNFFQKLIKRFVDYWDF